jgi:hypothetical protein
MQPDQHWTQIKYIQINNKLQEGKKPGHIYRESKTFKYRNKRGVTFPMKINN